MTEAGQVAKSVKLNFAAFNGLLERLAQEYRLYAPVRLAGRGRFSDTDQVRYGEVRSLAEIEYQVKSEFSPKEIVFPISETLFYFTEEQWQEPKLDARPVLVFLRACDINGLARLDKIFLENGPHPDPYYARRRAKLKFVLLECRESFDKCFCVAMGANRTDDYAMALRVEDGQVLAQVKDAALGALAEGEEIEFTPHFVAENKVAVEVPEPAALTRAIRERGLLHHELWEEYCKRCIGCGRCTVSCVSCACSTMHDIASDDNPQVGERRRSWASCHIDRFTDMAGGHRFREEYGDRMRYKTMHKIHDFRTKFGQNMCVGCGRCDDRCPEYISFSNCINRVAGLVKEGE